jgi:hypothetical protein
VIHSSVVTKCHWLHQNVQQILNAQVLKYVPTNIAKTRVKFQNHVTLLLNVLQLTIDQFVIVQMDGLETLKFSVINLVAKPIAIVFMIKHASTAIV